MAARIIGLDELMAEFAELAELLKKGPEFATAQLDEGMTRVVHVRTGYLKSTIYHKDNVAGADAPYAGYEADRGGAHDFAEAAIEDFDIERWADEVWKVFG